MRKRWIVILTMIMLLMSLVICAEEAEEKEKHTISIGIHPFGPLWGSYKVDVGIPVTGLLEVGAQINYFSFTQFAALYNISGTEFPNFLTVGGIVRVFPSQMATGFFIGGRLMYLNVLPPGASMAEAISDMTAGVDIGWRFKWYFKGGWGMFFQTYFGLQRWIFQGGELESTLGIVFPIWPTLGMHFGVYL